MMSTRLLPPTARRAFTALLVLLTFVCVLGTLARPASAFERRVEVDGWSADGRRVIHTVEVRGASVDGEPFRYRLRQVVDARTGDNVGTFRDGEATGPEQPAWASASPQSSAENVLRGLRVRSAPPAPLTADLMRAAAIVTQETREPDPGESCPQCSVCVVRWSLILMDGAAQRGSTLDAGSTRGPRSPQADCPEVRAESWWSPSGDAVLVVRSERAGPRLDTARVYRVDDGSGSHRIERPVRPLSVVEAQRAVERAADELRQRDDRAAGLVELGQLALRMGVPQTARDYFAAAQAVGAREAAQYGILLADALLGGRDAQRELARLQRGRRGTEGLPIAAVLHALGDTSGAARHAGGAWSTEDAALVTRYHLGRGIELYEQLADEGRDGVPASMLMDLWIEAGDAESAVRWAPRGDAPEGSDLDQLLWLGSHARAHEDVWATGQEHWDSGLYRCRFLASLARAAVATGRRNDARSLLALAVACDPDDDASLLLFARAQLAEQRPLAARIAYERFLRLTRDRVGDRAGSDRRDEARTILAQADETSVVIAQYRCVTTPRVRCTGVVGNAGEHSVSDAAVLVLAFDEEGQFLGESIASVGEFAPGDAREFSLESPDLGGAALIELRTEADGARSSRGLVVSDRPSFP